jgi:hypothetical protein
VEGTSAEVTLYANLEGVDQVTEGFRRMGSESESLGRQIKGMGLEVRDLGLATGAVARLGEQFGFLNKEQANTLKTWSDTFTLSGTLIKCLGDIAKSSDLVKIAEVARGVAHRFANAVTGGLDLLLSLLNWIRTSSIAVAVAESARAIAHGIANAVASLGTTVPAMIAAAAAAAVGIGAIIAGSGIVGMAEGGLVYEPTLALVGERGPEAVVPLHQLLSSSSTNTTINLTINESRTPRETGDAVIDALRRRGLI